MIPLVTTLAKSITGKIVLGLTVATMGVGAAAAAGAELPSLTNAEETAEQTAEETTEDTVEDTAEATGEDTAEGTDESPARESAALTDAEPTHGEVVSTFTRETELVGCAKGQATAAVARGDVDPSSPTLSDDLTPYVSTCSEIANVDEDEDEEADDSDPAVAEAGWKDVRDENKATWHDAKDAFEAACGDDDGDDDGDEEGDAEGDDGDTPEADLSPECEAMKSELKQLHTDGRTEWHDARDAAHEARKAERAAAKASEQGQSGKGQSGKGQSGKGQSGKGKSGQD